MSAATPAAPGSVWSIALVDASGKTRPLKEIEAEAVRSAIVRANGCMAKAARELGIGRSTIYRKIGEQP